MEPDKKREVRVRINGAIPGSATWPEWATRPDQFTRAEIEELRIWDGMSTHVAALDGLDRADEFDDEPGGRLRLLAELELSLRGPSIRCPRPKPTLAEVMARLVSVHNQRAARVGQEATLTVRQWAGIIERFRHRCAYCPARSSALDHVVPIHLGGGTTAFNCVPACHRCNSRKGRQDPLVWLNNEGRMSRLLHFCLEAS